MGGQIGVTFGLGGGVGGLVVLVLYVVLGPGALLYHGVRLAIHVHRRHFEHAAYLNSNDLDTARRCLPWNIGIAVLPALPALLGVLSG
jgi:hypothetical protein